MIVGDDGPDRPALRVDPELMARHWEYERSIRDRILAAGSLRSEDGNTPVGSRLIVDVPTRDEALALLSADPAIRAGLRTKVTVRYGMRAILDCVPVE
jgi:uncharacterized protein YciI